MQRCFIFQEGNSQKFWNIEVIDEKYTVTYGKLGSAGQVSEKSFASAEACQKEADKQIASKLKKGYTETTAEIVASTKNEGKRYETSDFDKYEEGDMQEFVDKIVNDKRLPEIKHIVIGQWPRAYEDSCDPIISAIIENKERFAHVESIYFGDIDSEWCELSWINQGNYSGLLEALPHLKSLIIQGNDPRLGKGFASQDLQTLEIYMGGLGNDLLDELLASDLPNLTRLVVYHGIDDYAPNGKRPSVESFLKLADPKKFPKLAYLGLNDSDDQDKVTEGIVASDIIGQLETLDLSYGTLTDKGVQVLIDNADKLKGLKKIVAEFHFASNDAVKKLKAALPIEIDFSNAQNPTGEEMDEDDFYPYFTE